MTTPISAIYILIYIDHKDNVFNWDDDHHDKDDYHHQHDDDDVDDNGCF